MKKLYRIKDEQNIFGVCAGLGEYFNIDPAAFRIIFISFSLFWAMGLWIYIMFLVFLPSKENLESETDQKS